MQKPRLPANTFGRHSSIERNRQSQTTLSSPIVITAHQGASAFAGCSPNNAPARTTVIAKTKRVIVGLHARCRTNTGQAVDIRLGSAHLKCLPPCGEKPSSSCLGLAERKGVAVSKIAQLTNRWQEVTRPATTRDVKPSSQGGLDGRAYHRVTISARRSVVRDFAPTDRYRCLAAAAAPLSFATSRTLALGRTSAE